MNMNNISISRLQAISNGAMATFPNEGAWMVSAQKRQAICLLALNPETWEEALVASFLSEVMSDTYQWDLAEAVRLTNGGVGNLDWDRSKKEWWTKLRESEAQWDHSDDEGFLEPNSALEDAACRGCVDYGDSPWDEIAEYEKNCM